VHGWVTVFGRVNHLITKSGTQAYSAWARPLWLGWYEHPTKAGIVNRHIAWYTSLYPWSCSVCWCLAGELACRDQRRRTGNGSALEACLWQCTIQIDVYFTDSEYRFTTFHISAQQNVSRHSHETVGIICKIWLLLA